ncbi:MAG: hypothetical protein L0F95_02165 [Lactococcus sp.]|nr:hypothetical protein [Lactococcus sp.]MDN5402850.1 hypothetical protein [Lactococcus sp.]MDN5410089.1 hypothetical protein [Lactococcus sp.]MDN5411202.1 hypothetical protein [Lactococcus sp.]MDN5435802.1 hypothetical protein [Lactococcus sp.]MDN5460686.1 hypothetical protein [Lactococcus sp.]
MKDPEVELRRGLHNIQTGHNLTYEEFCLYEIENLIKGELDAVKRNAKNLGTTAKRGKLISKHL